MALPIRQRKTLEQDDKEAPLGPFPQPWSPEGK